MTFSQRQFVPAQRSRSKPADAYPGVHEDRAQLRAIPRIAGSLLMIQEALQRSLSPLGDTERATGLTTPTINSLLRGGVARLIKSPPDAPEIGCTSIDVSRGIGCRGGGARQRCREALQAA